MKVIGYARCSTTQQATEGVTLEAQEVKIRAYCIANDLDFVAVIADSGMSGKTTDRDGLQAILAAVEAGAVQAVVVCKLDSLSRRVVDTLALIEQIEKAGAAIHSIAEKVDTRSAIGRFFLTIVAAFAEMERGVIAGRTVAALAHRKAIGEAVGRPGYGSRIEAGRVVADEGEAAVVARAAELRAVGYTLQAITDSLTAEGIPTKRGGTWAPSTLHKLLRRAA
jgi:DNA invertase Pin-like site-specific DNA recombinase